ncbi:MAG: DNA polymerase/3'-5' exonuclease PolX [Saprospirales bacterium]|nr:MAG: DNA polymerase/3'-5' exonuclease PolX [Saprospirales bacterium]
MTNRELAANFRKLADLLELLEENPFKIRSYRNAYTTLRRLPQEVADMERSELEKIKGVGKAISAKIGELLSTGSMSALEKSRRQIPPGVEELLNIKGLGPGKVRRLWKGLEVNSPGELLYACEENRLISLKGFGEKSQSDIRSKVEYYLSQRGLFFYSEMKAAGDELLDLLRGRFPTEKMEYTGEIRRLMPTLSSIEIITTLKKDEVGQIDLNELQIVRGQGQLHEFRWKDHYSVLLHHSKSEEFGNRLLETTGPAEFLKEYGLDDSKESASSEEKAFRNTEKAYVLPEHRDWDLLERAAKVEDQNLVRLEDIKGVVHAHSHYSDGMNSLSEMAQACKNRGFEYLCISDHSAYASYAGGMQKDKVEQQWREIDEINTQLQDFRLIKGIEADILPDGKLDYDPEFIKGFEVVIASVHSILNMDEERAVSRLIRAIENPATQILGHPTGRLLLSRPGYPLNMPKILDACAANGVVIEINANPHRLDLDWKWILPAMDRGIRFSINPDAHHVDGIDDIQYGLATSRKGGMTREVCINALPADEFLGQLR